MIRTDLVGSDIPLLLSRSAMKTIGVKMDLGNDTANIIGKDVALNLATSGHYCIERTNEIPVEEVMDSKDWYKKLHRQFVHLPQKKLEPLLQNAGLWNNEYVDLIEELMKDVTYVRDMPRHCSIQLLVCPCQHILMKQ